MLRTLTRLKMLAIEKAKMPGHHADSGGRYLVVKPGTQ